MLKVNLFGSGQARYGQAPIAGFPLQQPGLLLSYLLLNRHRLIHREPLASIFWGNCLATQSRKHLRNALWRLRHWLEAVGAVPEDYLFVSEERIAFVDSSQHWLDVDAFESAVTACQNTGGKELMPEQARALELAVELYAGDLLEDVYSDWCLYDRERLRLAYLHALGKLTIYHGLRGDYEQGLAFAQKILAVDATRENIHQQIMWLHFLAGDHGASMAQYHHCRQILGDELGIQPMAETQRLYEMIAHNSIGNFSLSVMRETAIQSQSQLHDRENLFLPTALEKLHCLQIMMEFASAELRLLETLIKEHLEKA
jgi:DNA-binding SARP family transcriptional activator